jgi:hypothetical protein
MSFVLFLQTFQHLIFPLARRLIPLMPTFSRHLTGLVKFGPDRDIPTPFPISFIRPIIESLWRSPLIIPTRRTTRSMHSTTLTALRRTLIGFIITQCTHFYGTMLVS